MKKFSLVGIDGNAFNVMGYTARAMKQAGFDRDAINKMYSEAKSGDYNHLLAICDSYIDKANDALGLSGDFEEEEDQW